MAGNQQQKRFKSMRKAMLIRGLTALAVCALVLSVVGSAKHPVERPFKASGIHTSVIDATGTAGTYQIAGNATHLGRMILKGTWEITGGDFDAFTYLVFHVAGTYTAANGDTLVIDIPEWVEDYTSTPGVGTGLVEIKGGTGRFANASGWYEAVIILGETHLFAAEGTISY